MDKIARLDRALDRLGSVVIAYSGGLDSAFLVARAVARLGPERVLAVTARSLTYPIEEYRQARRLARQIGARHLAINTKELAMPRFRENPVDRCYYCKRELFRRLERIRRARGFARLADGTNHDDLKDIRHGRKAGSQFRVATPLLEARMGKAEIAAASRALGLPTWDKPPSACLASRFPFHSRITPQGLTRVGEAEAYLRRLGIAQLRVRSHGPVARIEIAPAEFKKLISNADKVVRHLKKAGFTYVSMDLRGYRTGSMHEAA